MIGGTTAIVIAAIPDNSGVIHGCRSNLNGGLRVIDDANQQCRVGETALNWNQTGPQGLPGEPLAYGYVNPNGTFDTTNSSGIESVAMSQVGTSSIQRHCINLTDEPKNAIVTADVNISLSGGVETATVTLAGIGSNDTDLTANCISGTDAVVYIGNTSEGVSVPFFVLFH